MPQRKLLINNCLCTVSRNGDFRSHDHMAVKYMDFVNKNDKMTKVLRGVLLEFKKLNSLNKTIK